jgi:hypothetical protein
MEQVRVVGMKGVGSMQRAEIGARGVHEELDLLFRSVEQALDRHRAGTERAITDALSGCDRRLADRERRGAEREGRA